MSQLLGVRIAGTGSCVPERVVTNEDLSKTLDTSDEWIRSRTGIGARHFARPDEATSDFAIPAARKAIEAAGVAAEDIDLIVCATMTPDRIMPTTAALMQRALKATRAGGFDLNSACSGFVLAITSAANAVRTGTSRCALVVGAETMTRIVDPADRSTAVIFADGAGAVVLLPSEDRSSDLLACRRGLRGDDEVLTLMAGGSRLPVTQDAIDKKQNLIVMKGRETFKFAVKTFASLIQDTCREAGIEPKDLALVVPHQVNMRILEKACERSGITLDDCMLNIEKMGNTSAASVAIALDEAVRTERVKRGDLMLMVAFGGGLSWGSALVRY